jgi:arylsulfatase A-like enzyme
LAQIKNAKNDHFTKTHSGQTWEELRDKRGVFLQIPLAKDSFAPVDMPLVAWHSSMSQLNQTFNLSYSGNATRSRIYRRAYYASVAYTDYNIGRLLETLVRKKAACFQFSFLSLSRACLAWRAVVLKAIEKKG